MVAGPCEKPGDQEWETVISESSDVIQGFDRTRDLIAVLRLVRATSRLTTHDLRGADEREIVLRSLGAVEMVDGDRVGDGLCYTFQSFTQPPIAFVADARTGETQQVVRLAMPRGLDVASIAVEQTTYPSRDGTPVTMFLVRRSDVRPTGAVPTLLTGYGGFNISRTPAYFPGAAAWVEAGGLFALPNLRGGGGYGARGPRARVPGQKQNRFVDFHAAADALIALG